MNLTHSVGVFVVVCTMVFLGGCNSLGPMPREYRADMGFSPVDNPARPWCYGWKQTVDGDFRPAPVKIPNRDYPWLLSWQALSNQCAPVIEFSASSETNRVNGTTIRPGQLFFHPGPCGELAVIRWTAPRRGNFRIHGSFSGMSGYQYTPLTTTDVHILHKAHHLLDAFINLHEGSNTATFDLSIAVGRNDNIDFMVGTGNGDYSWDSTALDAIITPLP